MRKKIVICEYAAHLSLICIHIYVNTNDKMSSFVTLMPVSENLRKTKNINAQQTEYKQTSLPTSTKNGQFPSFSIKPASRLSSFNRRLVSGHIPGPDVGQGHAEPERWHTPWTQFGTDLTWLRGGVDYPEYPRGWRLKSLILLLYFHFFSSCSSLCCKTSTPAVLACAIYICLRHGMNWNWNCANVSFEDSEILAH